MGIESLKWASLLEKREVHNPNSYWDLILNETKSYSLWDHFAFSCEHL